MAAEDDDLYDEEYEFVDDEDGEDEEEEDATAGTSEDDEVDESVQDEETVDEYGRPEPTANYVVHVYEYEKFKRTLDRGFTPEDAEAFATEYNRTAKHYGRVAVAGKNDAKPRKNLA